MILYHRIEINIAIYLMSSRLIYFFVKSEIDCIYLDIQSSSAYYIVYISYIYTIMIYISYHLPALHDLYVAIILKI